MIERLRGVSIIAEDDKTELRRYLLGQLTEPDEERLEMRLVFDPAYVEEFDMMVDEITASYVAGQFAGEEKEQVERYFLRAPERRKKFLFMSELLDQVGAQQEVPAANVRHDRRPGFAERVREFLRSPQFAPRFAMVAIAVVLLIGGVWWLNRSGGPTTVNYATLTVPISEADRSTTAPAPQIESIKLPADVNQLRLELLLPTPPPQSVTYRADFVPPANVRGLTIAGQDSRAVVIAVPASELKPDRYGVRLFEIHADGQEKRVPGTYYFRVD